MDFALQCLEQWIDLDDTGLFLKLREPGHPQSHICTGWSGRHRSDAGKGHTVQNRQYEFQGRPQQPDTQARPCCLIDPPAVNSNSLEPGEPSPAVRGAAPSVAGLHHQLRGRRRVSAASGTPATGVQGNFCWSNLHPEIIRNLRNLGLNPHVDAFEGIPQPTCILKVSTACGHPTSPLRK